jgi:hypothetical protein
MFFILYLRRIVSYIKSTISLCYLCVDQWLCAIRSGVTWFGSGHEEGDDLDIMDPDHHDTPQKVPHLLPTTTPRWCFSYYVVL